MLGLRQRRVTKYARYHTCPEISRGNARYSLATRSKASRGLRVPSRKALDDGSAAEGVLCNPAPRIPPALLRCPEQLQEVHRGQNLSPRRSPAATEAITYCAEHFC
eukprot:1195718-Prorocentrum_minimum.AAC.2